MAVTRINEFRAKVGEGDALRDLLRAAVPEIAAAAGCLSCQLLQGRDAPERIVVLEVWESPEAHQASLRDVPAEVFAPVMALLDGRPSGAYFDAVDAG